jgi:DNA-binding transcriptional LysR family regulator
MRCFAAVAETGSFTVAAARLFQTQSSLTAAVQQLEEAVGLKLFDRTTRRVELTDDAVRFKVVADGILRDFDNALSDLKAVAKSQRGHVSVAAVPSMIVHVLTPALTAFRKIYPAITISVHDAGSDKIEREVLDGAVDFGIASRLNNYSELDYVPILNDPFGVVFPDDHPLKQEADPVNWADLSRYEQIALTTDTGIGAFLDAYPGLGVRDSSAPHDHASSTASLFAMLSLGGKVAVLPMLAAKAGPLAQFNFRQLHEPKMTLEICLITRHLRSFSVNTQRMLDVLKASIGEADRLTRGE